MGKPFSLTPVTVPRVDTNYRRILTPLPHPESVPLLLRLQAAEPISMQGQPPLIWHRAEGVNVYDAYGNVWLDWSSGVLVTNAGHGHPAVKQAIRDQADQGLLHNYVFPSAERMELCELLASIAPPGLNKVFLVTTGSETTECALKLMRTHGLTVGGPRKNVVVSFGAAFHGRTLGAQQMGGMPALKDWIVHLDPGLVQVPFPDGFRHTDTRFEGFLEALAAAGVSGEQVAGVISETYQGVGPDFLPVEYAQRLRAWCDEQQAVLTFDEVQAGFGRCGTRWGFEHYGVTPDLICCGKGISSSLPLGAVIGRPELLDLYPPGSMTSTHSGNPVCCAAAIASIQAIEDGLIENARVQGDLLRARLSALQAKHPTRIGAAHAVGLVAGLQMVVPGTTEPDADAAHAIVEGCFQRGLLFFAPVGVGGACVKISPPLCIDAAAIEEGCDVLQAVTDEVLIR
ncbi:MAG: aminotransferase class III-fold pyridoxal phosphate-dependent enzyme [Fimbriimonadaceae bacterium]|nr:aminotransferase class III-fold pyridoxal phosphate-dependent enzyme [Fimbriimonadaceae bacterium]